MTDVVNMKPSGEVGVGALVISIPQTMSTIVTEEMAIKSPRQKPRRIKYEPLVLGTRYRGIGYDEYCCLCGGSESTFGTFIYYSKPRDVVTYNDLRAGVYPEPLHDFIIDKNGCLLEELNCGCSVHKQCLKTARERHKQARCPPNEHDEVMRTDSAQTYIIYFMIALCLIGIPICLGAVFLYTYLSKM